MYHQRLQFHNALLAYNLWTGEGDFIDVFEDQREQIDDYETDSDEEESDFKEHSELVNRACVT